jgi:hypothetical protein
MPLELNDGEFCIDASLLGQIFNLSPLAIQALMRRNEITSLCERGEGEHAGRYRLTFFYGNKRAAFVVDGSGCVLGRSVINLGERPRATGRRRIAGR